MAGRRSRRDRLAPGQAGRPAPVRRGPQETRRPRGARSPPVAAGVEPAGRRHHLAAGAPRCAQGAAMAGAARLNPRAGPRLLMLLAIVLALHALTLHWLGRYLEQKSALKPLATPMFTRLLKPEAAPAPPVPVARAAPEKPKRPAITSIAKPATRAKSTVAAAPSPPASE